MLNVGKQRIIYSKTSLSQRQKLSIAMLFSENDYTCGAPLTEPNHTLHGKVLVRLNIQCSSPMEKAYYSSDIGRKDTCYYCGNDEGLVDKDLTKRYKTVFPLCAACAQIGAKHACMRLFGKAAKKATKNTQ